MEKKIDILLLSGFLGAGKTTLLNELIGHLTDRRLGILINDFGEVPVDGSLLKSRRPELLDGSNRLYEIGNGSIFCSCLKAPFLYGLKYFRRESPDILIIEASGLSDPSSIGRFLKEHALDEDYTLSGVITLVDPVKYPKLVHVLEAIDKQIKAADALLINKTDLVPSEELDEIEEELRHKNPRATMLRGSFGRFDWTFLNKTGERELMGDGESCNTQENRPASLHLLKGDLDRTGLDRFLQGISEDIFRVKGYLTIDGQLTYVSDTGRDFSFEAAADMTAREGLTLLCPLEKADSIRQKWETL